MLRSSTLYVVSGVLFLLAFALGLPDLELHGWLFLTLGLTSFCVALWHAGVEEHAQGRR